MKYILQIFLLFPTFIFSQYSDFIIDKNKSIWAINMEGKIVSLTLSDKQNIVSLNHDKPIFALYIDKNGKKFGVANNEVFRFKKNGTWKSVFKDSENISNIIFDTHNKVFLISRKGIMSFDDKKYYFPTQQYTTNPLLKQYIATKKWSKIPLATMIDGENKIWISIDLGEFGRELYLFDTNTKKYENICPSEANFFNSAIKCFFTFNNHIYGYTSSRYDAGEVSNIVYFDSLCEKEVLSIDEYISTVNINSYDSCLYFSSNKGFYKQETYNSSIFIPISKRSEYLNITKIIFIDTIHYVFLAQDKQILYFDGKKLNVVNKNSITKK